MFFMSILWGFTVRADCLVAMNEARSPAGLAPFTNASEDAEKLPIDGGHEETKAQYLTSVCEAMKAVRHLRTFSVGIEPCLMLPHTALLQAMRLSVRNCLPSSCMHNAHRARARASVPISNQMPPSHLPCKTGTYRIVKQRSSTGRAPSPTLRVYLHHTQKIKSHMIIP